MSNSKNPSTPTCFNRSAYVGALVRADIPGALAYLDACGETERGKALRQRLTNPPASTTDYAFLNPILNTYQSYFQACFSAGLAGADDPKAAEREARKTLELKLQVILALPEADLDELEEAIKGKAEAAGLHFLGGETQGYRGPYIWQETTQTDYEVELPLGTETLTVFWMNGFLMRSWLDWLTGGEAGAGGWAKNDGIYCVRKAYEDQIDKPPFTISFLKHEAQHHADLRRWDLSPSDLEYRAKLVELIYYPDASFLHSLLTSGDLSDRDNSHAYAAAKITEGLAARVEGGMEILEKVGEDEAAWVEKRVLFDEHTALLEQADGGKN